MLFSVTSLLFAAASLASTAAAASLQQVTNFGTNPNNAEMWIYVPDTVTANPAIVVGVHWCTGSAQAFYSGTGYKALADTYGFIVVYPSAVVPADHCWDVASAATLTHNGGGDSLAIKNMVLYTIANYGADASRVYVTGHSSGGMMTNVMLGAYPEIFKAGAAFAGVPFGCFAGTSSWSTACATGQITKTPAEWGDLVRNAYPGYTGARPRMQLWHGTLDDTLVYHNFEEEIKQWTNVLGVSQTPTSTENNPFGYSGWVRTKYGTQVEAISEVGQPHNIIILADQVIAFFGLNTATATTTATSVPTTVSSTTVSSASATATGTGVAKWGQCGGITYTGATNCISGTTCTIINPYYHQCL